MSAQATGFGEKSASSVASDAEARVVERFVIKFFFLFLRSDRLESQTAVGMPDRREGRQRRNDRPTARSARLAGSGTTENTYAEPVPELLPIAPTRTVLSLRATDQPKRSLAAASDA